MKVKHLSEYIDAEKLLVSEEHAEKHAD